MNLTRSFSRVATDKTELRILQVMKDLEDRFEGYLTGGGSPVILWNDKTGEIWVSVGDWHDSDVVQAIDDELEKVQGVKKVDGESESFPEGYNYGDGNGDWKRSTLIETEIWDEIKNEEKKGLDWGIVG